MEYGEHPAFVHWWSGDTTSVLSEAYITKWLAMFVTAELYSVVTVSFGFLGIGICSLGRESVVCHRHESTVPEFHIRQKPHG